MPSCAIESCGRKDLDEPAPGLELWEGKWSCTLCYCNQVRFKQPVFKGRMKAAQETAEVLARPSNQEVDLNLFGEDD
jgi:hypothetical protein